MDQRRYIYGQEATERLRERVIKLACDYGRSGYRQSTVVLRTER
jgi:hypothetical protein